jgi:circadian clock protein KaiB
MSESTDRSRAFEAALRARAGGLSATAYVFRLFVAGSTPRSLRAIVNLKLICAKYIEGEVSLRVIDVYQQPHLARADHVLAVPTLLQIEPGPIKRILGDLSDVERVVTGLNLRAKRNEAKRPSKTKRGR